MTLGQSNSILKNSLLFSNDPMIIRIFSRAVADYIGLSGCLFDKRKLKSSGMGTYLSRWVYFQRLAPESNK